MKSGSEETEGDFPRLTPRHGEKMEDKMIEEGNGKEGCGGWKWWRVTKRVLKWVSVVAGVAVVLLVGVCSLAVWILTPQRLTPLVERCASDFLEADVTAGRVELTFWHTFPKLTVDVDSLGVVSRSLDGLPDSVRVALPADADSLLFLRHFHGGVNVAALGVGQLALYDVVFDGVRVNLLQVNDSVANYMIVPTAEEADTTAAAMPVSKISINRFAVTDASPLRYRSMADSLDVTLNLHEVALAGHDAPVYRLGIDGNLNWDLLRDWNLESLTFGAQGEIDWDMDNPMAVAVEGFRLSADSLQVTVDASVDFSHVPLVRSLKVESGDISVSDVLRHMPEDMRKPFQKLETDMTARVAFELKSPWLLTDSVLPSLDGRLSVPECSAVYDGRLFSRIAASVRAEVDGKDMDASRFVLERLVIEGECVDIDLRARVTDVESDPLAEGRFKGSVNLSRLPAGLRDMIPGSVEGLLKGDADFRLRRSDLSRERFHRLYAKGSLDMEGFSVSMDTTGYCYARHATFAFGSNTAFVNDTQQKVDSLLTFSLKIDTLAANVPGIDVELRGLRAGAGTVNRSSSADTTEINPFGMKLAIERLKMDAPDDTVHLRVRGASVAGSLRRYKGDARLPQMHMQLGMEVLFFGQALNKVALRQADVALDLHMRPRRQSALTPEERAARRKARADSLAVFGEQVPGAFDLDSGNRRLLRRWDFSGKLKAKSGRLVTPAFPLRNRLDNIDLRFNQDSIQLTDLHYEAGQSDFVVNGTISNLRRALTARRDNTLGVNFTLRSDTINVNEIVRALFAGGSMVENADSAMVWSDDDRSDLELEQQADTSAAGPLLVPRNIDARLRMRAKNILYSDLVLHSFKGDLLVMDGAVNLRRLQASTDIGSIKLDGLYSGATVDSLQFGLGMEVSNFRLDRLTSIIPAIDSLLPAMQSFAGTVNADVAVTTDISPQMDIEIPTLRAAIKIEGDSLVLLDADTFKMLSKWLFFKNKKHNMIDHMAVEVTVENSVLEIYPFMFDIDRYRLGVMGSNDLAMNMNYHVSVLKSPVPFKFGINIKGTPDDFKIRLGGAKFKDNMVGERQAIADNTRVNIVQQIDNVFRRGIAKARRGRLTFGTVAGDARRRNERLLGDFDREAISPADSLRFIRQGLIAAPDSTSVPHVSGIGN